MVAFQPGAFLALVDVWSVVDSGGLWVKSNRHRTYNISRAPRLPTRCYDFDGTVGTCSVLVIPHEFSRLISNVDVLAAGLAQLALVAATVMQLTTNRAPAIMIRGSAADLTMKLTTMSLLNDAGGRVALVRPARARYMRFWAAAAGIVAWAVAGGNLVVRLKDEVQ